MIFTLLQIKHKLQKCCKQVKYRKHKVRMQKSCGFARIVKFYLEKNY